LTVLCIFVVFLWGLLFAPLYPLLLIYKTFGSCHANIWRKIFVHNLFSVFQFFTPFALQDLWQLPRQYLEKDFCGAFCLHPFIRSFCFTRPLAAATPISGERENDVGRWWVCGWERVGEWV
jgi:hypothetical protein